ncbi:MAG: AAA family ATPase [Pseudomonadota bacterium]
MPRTGATRRHTGGPLQALFNRFQAGASRPRPSTDAPDGRLTDRAILSLGLHNQPFRAPGGQIPYFYNDQLATLLDELETCVGNAETLVILEGADESGKTCTIAQLLERFYDGGHVFLTRAGAGVSADAVIRSMLSAYRSTTPQTLAECTEQLVDHLAENADLGATSVLVVEDVDRMPVAEMQALLQEVDCINAQIAEPVSVLFSSAEPAEALLDGVHSQHIEAGQVDAFTVPRLDADETASYIATRLASAGYDDDLPLDERELRMVTHSSNGLPGYIDRAAAQALNTAFNRQQWHALMMPGQWWRATRRNLRWVLAGLTMLVIGLALGAWNAQPRTQGDTLVKSLPLPTNPGANAVAEAPTGAEPIAADNALEIRTAQTRVEPVPVETGSTETDTAARAAEVDAAAATETSTAPAAAATAAAATAAAAPAVEASAGERVEVEETAAAAATAAEPAQERVSATGADATTAIESTAAESTAAESTAAAVSSDVAASDDAAAATAAETESAAVSVQAADPATPQAAAPARSDTPRTAASVEPTPATTTTPSQPINNSILGGVISGEKWIQRRDPDRFTVQLLAGADEAALRLHARRHGMTSLSAIYRTLRNGQPWFALVHGDFDSSGAAREAVASLPEVWQENSPWIRTFGDVQRAID